MTEAFISTPRYLSTLSSFHSTHLLDPTSSSATYHALLSSSLLKLSSLSSPPLIPSEPLLLAANCQHIRRWEFPRDRFPTGLVGYKSWRSSANKFHAGIAVETMRENGYDVDGDDAPLAERVKDLLLKKGLARPPLVPPFKDPELQLLEDAICLVFLTLQFATFTKTTNNDPKMVEIVRKTWAKMTDVGRGVVADELLDGLDEGLKGIVVRALE